MIQPILAVLGLLGLAGAPTGTEPVRVQGDYIESRTADIYTGPCFSNAEVFLTGHQAVVAWKVREGSWDGVDLAGLTVAAALKGSTTFSKDDPAKARAVVIVDGDATPAQRDALIAMVRALGDRRFENIVAVKTAHMNLFVEHVEAPSAGDASAAAHHAGMMPHAPKASFYAPGLAEISTRPLDDSDHLCGNEVVAYPPLSKGVNALPAYTLGHWFKGQGLNSTWDDHNCRGSFVGQFAF